MGARLMRKHSLAAVSCFLAGWLFFLHGPVAKADEGDGSGEPNRTSTANPDDDPAAQRPAGGDEEEGDMPPMAAGVTDTGATGVKETPARRYPSHATPNGVFVYPAPGFRDLAEWLQSGTMPGPDRRGYFGLERMLYPYTSEVPSDWRVTAQAARKALAPPAALGTSYTWTPIGSGGLNVGGDKASGRATCLAVDPADGNHIFLGTACGGVWETSDQGVNWTPVFEDAATLSIGALALEPGNAQVVYAGTGEGNYSGGEVAGVGVYKSLNGGDTWTLLPALPWVYPLPDHNIRRIVVDPRDVNRVYAAADGGLMYSLDGGGSWTRTDCSAVGSVIHAADVYVDSVTPTAGQPSWIYVSMGREIGDAGNGIYRSKNGPAGPWTKITPSGSGFATANIGRINLAGAPSAPNTVYAMVSSSATHQLLGIYQTTDAGAASPAWSLKTSSSLCGGQCGYNMCMAVEPGDATRMFFGGIEVSHSRNSAGTFTAKSNWNGSGATYVHADVHALAMPNATTVYAVTDGGFFAGTISGPSNSINVDWVNRNAGLPTIQHYGYAHDATNTQRVMGGTQDNGMAYWNGSTWTMTWIGDGVNTLWDSADPRYAYLSHGYAALERNTTMDSNPSSWTCVRNWGGCTTCSLGCAPDGRTHPYGPLVLDAVTPNTMYAGSYRVWRNTAARTGTTWSAISGDLTGGGWLAFIHPAYDNGVGGTIYTGSSDGRVFVTTNNGSNWTERSTGLPNAWIESITTDPADADNVLVTFNGFGNGHVFRSVDGGQNWTDISGALPDMPMNDIAVDPAASGTAFVAGEMGVFVNTDVWAGATWYDAAGTLPATKCSGLGFHPVNGKLRMSTYGRGMYELTVTVTASNPKEASPADDLLVTRGAGTALDVAYSAACGATDHTVYAGDLATLQSGGISWSARHCTLGADGTLTFDPGSSDVYFVVVGRNESNIEGSYGQATSGERPAAGAGGGCSYTQDLTGACP